MFAAQPNQPPFEQFAVPISCDFTDGPTWALGVHRDDGTIALRPDVCDAVAKAVSKSMRNRAALLAAAQGVLAVGHELSHVLGTHDQNVTAQGEDSSEPDCWAWMMFRVVANKLGISRSTTMRLAPLVQGRGMSACFKIGVQP